MTASALQEAAAALAAGDPARAELLCRAALARSPGAAPLHDLHGDALEALGRPADAIAAWRQAVDCDPDCVPSLVSLGIALAAGGDAAAAVPLLHRATGLAEGPPAAAIWHNMAIALAVLGHHGEAGAAWWQANRLDPANPAVALALAARLRAAGDAVGAESVLQALPDGTAEAADAMHALASDRLFAHDTVNGERLLRATIRRQPDHAVAHHDLGLVLLALGRFPEGFAEMEWRRAAFGHKRRVVGRRWTGQTAPGDLLLIHHEQGYGDFIQFCRYVPLAAQRLRVALEVPTPLIRLVSHAMPGVERIIRREEGLAGFNFECPIMSLPLAFGTTPGTVPAAVPYLSAAADAVAVWRARLAAVPGRKIGLTWAGSPDHGANVARSIPPDLLAPLGGVPGISFVSLQLGAPACPPFGMLDWTDELTDFADTAALVTALDLVISVDTAVAHLAGALARPVWVLNWYDADWRWQPGPGGRDNLWYPTARQFRQTERFGWGAVVEQVTAAARELTRPPTGG
jgi:Flp pilus assembly protein TadD